MFDPKVLRRDFPILTREVKGKPLVYLDSAATSQKPREVLLAEKEYYEQHNANVHRGAHTLGDEATQLLAKARQTVARFVGVREGEVIFVRNTTEALNLVAYTWGLDNLKQGDTMVTTVMEHHSNLVPWQEVARRTGAKVEVVGVTSEGLLDLAEYQQKLTLAPKLVAFGHVSNALGTINPVKKMTKMAHKAGAVVVVDGAQAVPHMGVKVNQIGCDFYAFSGHKMLGPMGIGVLVGRREILDPMSPFLTGGGMINEVTRENSTWADLPDKFEAGTPNVAGAVGLASAIDYLERLGMEEVRGHDKQIVEYALQEFYKVRNLVILGPKDANYRSGSVSFEYQGVHAHDVATILDSEGVAVRSGHHCTMPLHKSMGITASVRASFNVYTTKEDIKKLVEALQKVKTVFGK
ncbi:MAG: cysteine desulfurase SufS subfamily, cysteine desulfurase / selenocysteine lyase [Microgenomates group bacterium GW2011_GWC1_46_16]|uniref:Cysteine desulfurase n=2 Tax=Candidatus Collieribacteriota TaxID=1752725 RepID=A0A1F5FXP9_9BACT|nr:MAG: Cysteine desulfurase [Microgenomates group bacterium GW2011_GWF1_46_12]KKU27081.1 MAG: cysteine desulfurase SufS subfamily, cysteine desulfurase / selenocysteine lyase [Microgenomates group bacterium GW2011_GWC1_46_16]KKU27877.1 MAG: Cysteine desulfurase [Microgenomates group bacterium GW2011_GWF2_46_18]KKU43512.1 MAG: Cysteine desulfurase [Microgenomates group bacterium GW2011_GWA1_46_7]KKU44937.1 MAG: Cysteine desulfurase [Microgenomates group bacterium GW2011_GWB1_46_7]KKU60820.1 MA